jgi:hypothetical protein
VKRNLKLFLSFILVISTSSCATHFKNSEKEGTFIKDSEFLKQEYDIQEREKTLEDHVDSDIALNDKEKKTTHKADIKLQPTKKVKKPVSPKNTEPHLEKPMDLSSLFPEGERVVLSASYFGVEAGRVHIGIKSDKLVNGQEALHFYALGKTSSLFSLVYKVRDSIESLWSPKLERPLTLAFDVDETKQKYKTRSYFDWDKNIADYFEEGWHKKKGDYKDQKTWELPKKAQDIVSAIFYVRTLPLEVGNTYTFNVMENHKVIQTHLKVDRREVISTNIGKRSALVLKPSFKTKGKFKKVGDISIWVTDDQYKQILRVESKIKIGTVMAKVESITRPNPGL